MKLLSTDGKVTDVEPTMRADGFADIDEDQCGIPVFPSKGEALSWLEYAKAQGNHQAVLYTDSVEHPVIGSVTEQMKAAKDGTFPDEYQDSPEVQKVIDSLKAAK